MSTEGTAFIGAPASSAPSSAPKASRLRRPVGLWIGLILVAGAIAASLVAPAFTPYSPSETSPGEALLAPLSPNHLLGTDEFGRDILTRMLYAVRIDIAIGIGGTVVTLVLGTMVGIVVALRGGVLDSVIMRIVDVLFAFPFLVLIIALVAFLGPGLLNLFVAIWLVGWISYARIARAQTMAVARREYIQAARCLGFSRRRIALRHVLPNVVRYCLVFASVDIVGNMLLGAALGYLGLGVRPPTPELGGMIAEGQAYILTNWWLSALPGAFMVLVGTGFSLIGDALSGSLDGGEL